MLEIIIFPIFVSCANFAVVKSNINIYYKEHIPDNKSLWIQVVSVSQFGEDPLITTVCFL